MNTAYTILSSAGISQKDGRGAEEFEKEEFCNE